MGIQQTMGRRSARKYHGLDNVQGLCFYNTPAEDDREEARGEQDEVRDQGRSPLPYFTRVSRADILKMLIGTTLNCTLIASFHCQEGIFSIRTVVYRQTQKWNQPKDWYRHGWQLAGMKR